VSIAKHERIETDERVERTALPHLLTTTPEDFESPLAVEMRRLYTKLRPRLRRENLSVLMVTSAEHGEGKSTTSSNLAVTVARHKRTETVLIDGDLRRPVLHKMMDLPRGKGLSDLLRADAKLADVLRETPHENLRIITCGTRVQSPGGLFETRALTRLVAELRTRYEMVIFDAPPVMPVADSTLLGAEVDGVILVAMAGLTPREVILRARDVLRDGRANLLGVVLNNAANVLPSYYDYDSSSYGDE
jgi:capsular exopolysaccharide synthesis family protein